jgi:hypothetical protein
MIRDKLRDKDYDWLMKKDYEIYPSDKPATKDVFEQWYLNDPEFGIVFRESGEIKATNITIPLNRKGWEGLINGRLIESECKQEYIFNSRNDYEIGLHVYHIRKSDGVKEFYKTALLALNEILEIKRTDSRLRVIGLSALCVTKMGIGLFFNRLNCREQAFVTSEHILEKNGKILLTEINSYEELAEKLDKGYAYINRCKMLVTYPGEPSLVWEYINEG